MTKEVVVDLDNPFGMEQYVEGEDLFERALHNIMATLEGRTVVWALLGQTKIYNETFAGNSHDIYDKGRRSIGLWLVAQLTEIDPTIYPRMLLDVAKQEQRAIKAANQQEQDK